MTFLILRFYIQCSLQAVWRQIIGDNRFKDIQLKFSPVQECLLKNQDSGKYSDYENVSTLQSEFFFSNFDPRSHYTLQVAKFMFHIVRDSSYKDFCFFYSQHLGKSKKKNRFF